MEANIHPIKRDILLRLVKSQKSLSFGELLPEELNLESYKFNYHLKQLQKKSLIRKTSEGYQLTEIGLEFISKLDLKGEVTGQFKVSVALYVFRDNNGRRELLMQKRLRRPFIDDITTIAGKVRSGEKILDAAKRKLLEEAGLEANFKHVGIQRETKLIQNGKIFEEVFYHYCVGNNPKGELVSRNEHGENMWVPVEHVLFMTRNNKDMSQENNIPIKRILSGNTRWFYSEVLSHLKKGI